MTYSIIAAWDSDGVPTKTNQADTEDQQQSLVDTQKTKDAADLVSANRRNSYPSIGDQLDAIWKGGDDQAAMKVLIDKVKSDNPKE